MKWLFFLVFFGANSILFAKPDPLRVGLLGSFPFVWKENGKYLGHHYEVAEGIASKMKAPLEVELAPMKRIVDFLKKGKIDAIIFAENKELEDLKVKKERIANFDASIFSKVDQKNPQSLKDVHGHIARIVDGCRELDQLKNVDWVETQSYEQAFHLLKAGRVQYVCGTVAFLLAIDQNGGSRNEIQSYNFGEKTLWIQTLPNYEAKRWAAIQKAVKSLKEDGTIDRLHNKYVK